MGDDGSTVPGALPPAMWMMDAHWAMQVTSLVLEAKCWRCGGGDVYDASCFHLSFGHF